MTLCEDLKRIVLEDLSELGYDVHNLLAPTWSLDSLNQLTIDGQGYANPDRSFKDNFVAVSTRHLSSGEGMSYPMVLKAIRQLLDSHEDDTRFFIYEVGFRPMRMPNGKVDLLLSIRLDSRGTI